MDDYTKKAILNRVEKIIKRVENEVGHTNGHFVANEILKEVGKLK